MAEPINEADRIDDWPASQRLVAIRELPDGQMSSCKIQQVCENHRKPA
jgi:hypothetical protein